MKIWALRIERKGRRRQRSTRSSVVGLPCAARRALEKEACEWAEKDVLFLQIISALVRNRLETFCSDDCCAMMAGAGTGLEPHRAPHRNSSSSYAVLCVVCVVWPKYMVRLGVMIQLYAGKRWLSLESSSGERAKAQLCDYMQELSRRLLRA